MKTTIISIGDELLTGQTLNTNLTYLAKRLYPLGIQVENAAMIRDDKAAIFDALQNTKSDLVIFTGGLGPTQDDLTKESICAYYHLSLVERPEVLERISSYFKRMKREMKPTNKKQAYFPKSAVVLDNHNGTAPGMLVEVEGKTIVLLPGPPSELQPMVGTMISHLKNYLDVPLVQRGYRLIGIGESDLEAEMQDFYLQYPKVNIAPYASVGEVVFIFTAKDEALLKPALRAFKKRFDRYIVGPHDESLESVVVHTLMDLKKVISLVESCSGGMLASRIVNVPDASKVFKESYVLYDNHSKIKHLGINHHIIEKFGAVSEQCVYELAYQLAQRTAADITVSISGIAGPSGGSEEKPVGTVYFGLHTEGKTQTDYKIFSGDRQMVRQKATSYALYLVLKALMHDEN